MYIILFDFIFLLTINYYFTIIQLSVFAMFFRRFLTNQSFSDIVFMFFLKWLVYF